MADLPKTVRDAAQSLSDAIAAAVAAGYHVSPSGLPKQLAVIAVSETEKLAEKAKADAARAAGKSSPEAPAKAAPAETPKA